MVQSLIDEYQSITGVFSGLRSIVQRESALGLFRGNGAQMVRVFPYAAIQFLSFEIYKSHLVALFGNGHRLKFAAGSMAGVTAALATYPLDLVRARLAFMTVTVDAAKNTDTMGKRVVRKASIPQTIRQVVKNEGGILALYKGLSPTLMAMVPYAGNIGEVAFQFKIQLTLRVFLSLSLSLSI